MTNIVPYCGPAPLPASLWLSWNLDPVLIGSLIAIAALYRIGCARLDRDRDRIGGRQTAAFYGGWLITALALTSPLCPLSVSLFAARVGQHMLLALVAAPLAIVGRAPEAIAAGLGVAVPRGNWGWPAPVAAAGSFTVLLWLWHAPAPYAATFSSTPVYWAMHITVFGSALWLWHGLLDNRHASLLARLTSGFASSAQMGFLGALITLASRPVYAPHALTTAAWGLGPLEDQQLGGIIMWVPGCLAFLAFGLLALVPVLNEAAPRAQRSV